MKRVILVAVFLMFVSMASADTYSLGGQTYGSFWNQDSAVSNAFTQGNYTRPLNLYGTKLIEGGIIYAVNASTNNLVKYDPASGTLYWSRTRVQPPNVGLTVPTPYLHKTDSQISWGERESVLVLGTSDGSVIDNFSVNLGQPNRGGGFVTEPFSIANSPFTRLAAIHTWYPFSDYAEFSGIYPNGSYLIIAQGYDFALSYNTVNPLYDSERRLLYLPSVATLDMLTNYFNGTYLASQGAVTTGMSDDASQYNNIIFDPTNHILIRMSYSVGSNKTHVLWMPTEVPPKTTKQCFVTSSCGSNGIGYNVSCTSTGVRNNTCFTSADCAVPTPTCTYIEADGAKYCTSGSAGTCRMLFKNSCYLSLPSTAGLTQRWQTYDYTTGELYTFAHNNTFAGIFKATPLTQCDFTTQTNATMSLFFSASVTPNANVLGRAVIDNDRIYAVFYNGTAPIFYAIKRSDASIAYQKRLTKSLYNTSISGDVSISGNYIGYLGYDSIDGSIYVPVDDVAMLKFSGINYTTCPDEDPHVADPMCYVGGQLDLANHQWCDTSVAPTENQPCTNRLSAGQSCIRDWQCVDGINQGWCDIDYNDTCNTRGSTLTFSGGALHWSQAPAPTYGDFYAYWVTYGNTNTLFDAYGVEGGLLGTILNITNTSLSASLNSTLFYQVIGGNSEGKEYWKSDILKGSDYVTTTTTTIATTSTTILSPPNISCTTNIDCENVSGSSVACISGVCVDVSLTAQCGVDADCSTGYFCDTHTNGKTYARCTLKIANETGVCYKDHECKSGDCVPDAINPADIYLDNSDLYRYYGGFCRGLKTLCNTTSECNPSTEFCQNIVGSVNYPASSGYCDTRRSLGGYCDFNSECAANLSCFVHICQYANYTGSECSPTTYETVGVDGRSTPIWSVCSDKDSCVDEYGCYCNVSGKCVPRVASGGYCLDSALKRIPDVCDVNTRCFGGYCQPYSYVCAVNYFQNGSKQPNTYDDEYCPQDKYCTNHNCWLKSLENGSCTVYYECVAGLDCVAGKCAVSVPSTTVTTTTLPANVQNTLIVKTSKSSYFRGDAVYLTANYYFKGAEITDGMCKFSVSPNVLNVSQQLELGKMYYSGGVGAYLASYPLEIRGDAASGVVTIVVTCNKSGYYTLSNSTTLTVSSINAALEFTSDLVDEVQGYNGVVGVRFRFQNASAVTGATCTLYVDGTSKGALSETGIGLYTKTYSYSSIGTHTYNVTCTKAGVGTATLSDSFNVRSSLPTGSTTTLRPVPLPNHCTDRIKTPNTDETDVDCGGSCDQCAEGDLCKTNDDCNMPRYYCRLYRCTRATCNDGFKNGYETCVDRGGSECPLQCECGDDYLLTGCNESGYESCNSSAGTCIQWPCLDNTQCPPLLLRIDGSLVSRSRTCVLDVNECRFKSETAYPNATTSMIISPLSGIVFKDDDTNFNFGNCQDRSNGFRVKTQTPTHTQFKILQSSYSPYIPASSRWQYFGTDGTDKTALINELCDFTSGQYRYAQIVFHSEIQGGLVSDETVDVFIYRTTFNVTALPSSIYDSGINFTLSRSGACYVRGDGVSPYIYVGNSTIMDINYFNLTNTTSVEWFCNSTYGEVKTGSFGHTGSWLMVWFLGILWGLLFGWFEWRSWYILIIVFVLMIIFPLLYLIWRDRRG